MKKLIFVIATFGLFMVEPTISYSQVVVSVRPARPKVVVVKPATRRGHIWVAGSWKWSRRKAAYVWTDGYWIKKRRGHRYVAGHWVVVGRGHKWVPGRWVRV